MVPILKGDGFESYRVKCRNGEKSPSIPLFERGKDAGGFPTCDAHIKSDGGC